MVVCKECGKSSPIYRLCDDCRQEYLKNKRLTFWHWPDDPYICQCLEEYHLLVNPVVQEFQKQRKTQAGHNNMNERIRPFRMKLCKRVAQRGQEIDLSL